MSRREMAIRKAVDKMLASRILRTVHNHEGFLFYNALGDYAGKNATSLKEFARKLQVIDIHSIDFHFSRGDFRRWIQFVLGDIDLATRINRIPQDTRGETLRGYLLRVVNERLVELKRI